MRTYVKVWLATTSMVLCASTVHAQRVNKSTLSGTLTSASVAVPDNMSATVFTTPAASTPPKTFILTQFCSTNSGPGNVTLSGNTFGQIVVSTSDECTTYDPGIALPSGQTLTCNNGGTGGTERCMVTGVISK